MFKNTKIKKSLFIGFGTTIGVSLVIIILCLLMLGSQGDTYQEVIDKEIAAAELSTECRLNANIAARIVRNMALAPQSTENTALEARANDVLETLNKDLATLKELDPLKDGSVDEYIASVNDWMEQIPDILSAIHTNRQAAAIEMIRTSCTPALDTMTEKARQLSEHLDIVKDEALAKSAREVLICQIMIVVMMVLATAWVVFMAGKIITNITVPAAQVQKALRAFQNGDFNAPVDFESKSELGEMCVALRNSQGTLTAVVSDICYLLGEMAKGNFDIRSRDRRMYVGSLSSILESLININHNLSDTLAQIDLSAEQVSAGAEQVSTGAQALAQGATEQASAVEELSATIADISTRSQNNARSSETAMRHSQSASGQVSESAKYMDEMVQAMAKISDSSQEISKIIATIENIAFQTNILALNAAVEAARAGSAGKGFAVVADEVRNLATKSDQAAKATKELIDHSINSVQDGNEIVQRVSESLSKTVDASSSTMQAIQEIAKAVEEESEAIAQVTEGIDQISSVVQTNSATSEESAAASEELSSQAALMKSLMAKFKLRQGGDMGSGYSSAAALPSAAPAAAEPAEDLGSFTAGSSSSSGSSFSKY
ncbi:MAG: methyl-accepting chemotaxis protein [Oscillibacter sp.]|nr:methyl-accepting chemotaxis protein [Oscillibacter sp.]